MAEGDITKTELAQELGLSKARISQLVHAGLPVKSDGRLNRNDALNWITRNVDPTRHRDRGAARAAQATRDADAGRDHRALPPLGYAAVERVVNPFDQGAVFAYLSLVYRARCVAGIALACGASVPVAWNIAEMMPIVLAEIGRDALSEAGIEPFKSTDDPDLYVEEAIEGRDWRALAADYGEAYNLEAWRAHGRRMGVYVDHDDDEDDEDDA